MAVGARLQLAFMASLIFISNDALLGCCADPTDGFRAAQLTDANFALHKPFDKPVQSFYSYVNGVHQFRLSSNSKPFKAGSPTEPRSEIRIKDYDYSSGVWQFEGYCFIPKGTTGVSIMQIHRSDGANPATDLMLMVFDGEIRFYSNKVVERDIYDRWIRINVIHDVDANKLTVAIDGAQKLQVNGRGKSIFYFKFGIYEQHDKSTYMESRWKQIKVYKKVGEI